MTISVHGPLDALSGATLVETLRHELDRAPTRVALDLLAVDGWTDAGASALQRCRDLTTAVSDGLHFRTGAGPGHEALLVAFGATDLD